MKLLLILMTCLGLGFTTTLTAAGIERCVGDNKADCIYNQSYDNYQKKMHELLKSYVKQHGEIADALYHFRHMPRVKGDYQVLGVKSCDEMQNTKAELQLIQDTLGSNYKKMSEMMPDIKAALSEFERQIAAVNMLDVGRSQIQKTKVVIRRFDGQLQRVPKLVNEVKQAKIYDVCNNNGSNLPEIKIATPEEICQGNPNFANCVFEKAIFEYSYETIPLKRKIRSNINSLRINQDKFNALLEQYGKQLKPDNKDCQVFSEISKNVMSLNHGLQSNRTELSKMIKDFSVRLDRIHLQEKIERATNKEQYMIEQLGTVNNKVNAWLIKLNKIKDFKKCN